MRLLFLALLCAGVSRARFKYGSFNEVVQSPYTSNATFEGNATWRKYPNLAPQPSPRGYGIFHQTLDHDDPSSKTFSQFYLYSREYWKGPGSPVVMIAPTFLDTPQLSDPYFTNKQLSGLVAERLGAAIVYLEHRYTGFSSPFSDLTTANLTYLTTSNAINDMISFASNVQLPFASTGAKSNAADVPWVLVGCSYGGNLAAWTASIKPGTFWAYHASSAPVHAISNYWRYWSPVQKGMPANCSKDVSLVIDHMDQVWANGTTEEIENLKSMFKMHGLEPSDIGAALAVAPGQWQEKEFFTGYDDFDKWCDYIENAVTTSSNGTTLYPTKFTAGPEGVGLQRALQGYATWFTTLVLPNACAELSAVWKGKYNAECFNKHNASSPMFTDTSVLNSFDRQWLWILCNEPFGAWQTGVPDRPSLVSRTNTVNYYVRQCGLYFPPGPNGETYGIERGKTEDQLNSWTGGWNLAGNTTRVSFANGEYDPWIHESVSSDFRPGGPVASSKKAPVFTIPGGFHCCEWKAKNGEVNEGVRAVINQVVDQLVDWVAEWPGSARNRSKEAH